jgi:hypothetical protein
MKEKIKHICIKLLDFALLPLSYLFLPLYKLVKKYGIINFPLQVRAFKKTGVYPMQDHYYNPQFVYSASFDAQKIRNLHLNFSLDKQLTDLSQLRFSNELVFNRTGNPYSGAFYLDNPAYGPGDADLYYLMVRNHQPKKIIEIGSGFSTMVCLAAIEQNKKVGVNTSLTCIEPYEIKWLDATKNIELIREKVENIPVDYFKQLQENDILFIDSSHIIRPENDVLFEYLEILPVLNKGVLIHIHDIFSPRHYRSDWLQEDLRLWNEQYLLEAFLYFNDSFEIVYSLNYLATTQLAATQKVLTNLSAKDQPASFWLRKIK